MDWDGSDDWIRTKFAEYLEAFTSSLTSIKDIFSEKVDVDSLDLSNWLSNSFFSRKTGSMNDFNQEFVRKWLKTHSFRQWVEVVTPNLYEDVSTQ